MNAKALINLLEFTMNKNHCASRLHGEKYFTDHNIFETVLNIYKNPVNGYWDWGVYFVDMPVLAYTLQYIGTLYHPSNLS